MTKAIIITIDGPSGAGKGALSSYLSNKLSFDLLDSGSIYRLAALNCIQNNIANTDELNILKFCNNLPISFKIQNNQTRAFLNNQDVTEQIRTEQIAEFASQIATSSKIRLALLHIQRDFANNTKGLVADGRDMGTIVFPDAQIKLFLTANANERAKRRFLQLQNLGQTCDFDQILENIKERDQRDQNRHTAPLIPAQDAIIIDSSDITIDEVFAKAYEIIKQKL